MTIDYQGYVATELQGHYFHKNEFGGFTMTFEAVDPSLGWPTLTKSFGSTLGTHNPSDYKFPLNSEIIAIRACFDNNLE